MNGRPRVPVGTGDARTKRRQKGTANPQGLILTEPVAPPAWLDTKAGQECFHDLQIPLIDAGILQSLDIPNLALMAQFWSDYIEARELIRKGKKTVAQYISEPIKHAGKLPTYRGEDPLVVRMDESLRKYMALLGKFAGSPIDRTKIVIREKKPKSGLDGIFGGEEK
jgi:phage terminase small subunit